ncbi:MAG: hypothetical protein ABIU11_03375 [Chitinophagaceae bacterium]
MNTSAFFGSIDTVCCFLITPAKAETGDIISVKAEKPILHGGENTRCDFKVSKVLKNAELGLGKEDLTLRYKSKIFPDMHLHRSLKN